MSWETEQWARKQRVGDPVRKAVLVAIANEADTSGRNAWPSIRFLAEDIEVSERTVQRRLQELEDMGFLRRETRWRPDGSQSSNSFDLIGYEPPEHYQDRPRRKKRRSAGGDNLTPPPDNVTGEGDASVTGGGDTADTPKTSPLLPLPPTVGDKSPPVPPKGPAAPESNGKKGGRLPDDWQPPAIEELPLTLQAVVRPWPPGAYEFVAARFVAHFLSATGVRATKRDWLQAFRNWLPVDAKLVMQLKRDGVDFLTETTRAAEDRAPGADSPAMLAVLAMQDEEEPPARMIRAALRDECGVRTYDGWLRPTAILITDNEITVITVSAFMRDWLAEHYSERIGALAKRVCGWGASLRPIVRVHVAEGHLRRARSS